MMKRREEERHKSDEIRYAFEEEERVRRSGSRRSKKLKMKRRNKERECCKRGRIGRF